MISDRIYEPKTKDYYSDLIDIDPPKKIAFSIEKRERFWKDDKELNVIYESPSASEETVKSNKKEATIFDFEKEVLRFRGGKSRDHSNRKRKIYDRTYKYSV